MRAHKTCIYFQFLFATEFMKPEILSIFSQNFYLIYRTSFLMSPVSFMFVFLYLLTLQVGKKAADSWWESAEKLNVDTLTDKSLKWDAHVGGQLSAHQPVFLCNIAHIENWSTSDAHNSSTVDTNNFKFGRRTLPIVIVNYHFSTVVDFSSQKYRGSTGHRNSWYQQRNLQ